MSSNRSKRRVLRGPTVPVPAIVATDLVAVAARAPVSAPEFPGLDEQATPIHDRLVQDTEFSMTDAEAQAMISGGFESWGLDEIAPLPIESLISDLKAQVGDGTAWVIESEVGHAVLSARLAEHLGEGDDDADDGPAGVADLADGPEGPPLVAGDGGDDPDPAGQG